MGEPRAEQLAVPVACKIPRHHQGPGQAIDGLPGLGLDPEQYELGRQRAGASGQKCVNAVRIGPVGGLGVVVQPLPLARGRLVDAQDAQEAVGLDGARAEQFGEPAGADAPLGLHLPQPVLGMHETQREIGVVGLASIDMGHAVGVTQDLDGRVRTRKHDLAVGLRQRAAQPQPADNQAQRNQSDADREAQPEPLEPGRHVSRGSG